MVGYKTSDIYKILENVAYLHLRMVGNVVTVGQERNKEIDFIAQKSGEKMHVQGADMLANEGIINREFGNLLEISDNFPKYVVPMDDLRKTQLKKEQEGCMLKTFV